jgi:hypothetical protein
LTDLVENLKKNPKLLTETLEASLKASEGILSPE